MTESYEDIDGYDPSEVDGGFDDFGPDPAGTWTDGSATAGEMTYAYEYGSTLTVTDVDGDLWIDDEVITTPNATIVVTDVGPEQQVTWFDLDGDVIAYGADADGDLLPDAAYGPVADPSFTTVDDSAMLDEVAEDTALWFEQGTDYTCAPSAITQVLNDFYAYGLVDEAAVAEWAADQGYLIEGSGMGIEGIEATLEHFGVPAHIEQGDWATVDAYLEDGHAVMLAVDGSEYWYDDQNLDQGHLVRIVDVDIERGVAVLSDSGSPDGQGLEVPLETLERAWDESSESSGWDHLMVVSDMTDPDGVGAM